MYRTAIKYYGLWLAPGSVAYQLHQDRKMDALEAHLKAVREKEKQQDKIIIKPKE